MAKTRAQRKAERRAREQRAAREAQRSRDADSRAQARTQVPESADVVEAELAEEGADLDQLASESPDGAATQEAPPKKQRRGLRAPAARVGQAPPGPQRPRRAAPAWPGHRLLHLVLGRAQASPVARPRDADPGLRRDGDLHRGRRGLPGS